jgi:hypothetical protein
MDRGTASRGVGAVGTESDDSGLPMVLLDPFAGSLPNETWPCPSVNLRKSCQPLARWISFSVRILSLAQMFAIR